MGVLGGLASYATTSFLLDPVEPPIASIDVDKSWHALSMMLCPSDRPYDFVDVPHPFDPIRGGTPFGDYLEHGTAYFTPAEVHQIADRLAAMSDDDVHDRYEPVRFVEAGLYLHEVWGRDATDATWSDYLLPNLEKVRAFYVATARHDRYVVTWIA